MQQQAAAVDELGAGIGNVAEGQQKLLEDVSESMVQLTQLQEVAQSVEQGMRESQALHEHLIESERQVTRQLTNLEALHSEHATEVHKTWQVGPVNSCRVASHCAIYDSVVRLLNPGVDPFNVGAEAHLRRFWHIVLFPARF